MRSSFAEQLGPRVRIQAIDRVNSGSRARVVLSPESAVKATVTVAKALVRRGVKASVARHVAESLAASNQALVEIPHYEAAGFRAEMAPLGVSVAQPKPVAGGEVARLRKRLNLSQEQFANSVGLDVRTVQNWEQRRVSLDGPTALLVKVMERYPDLVQRVAADDPANFEAVDLGKPA